jgi:DNA-binding NtrC family response regulator
MIDYKILITDDREEDANRLASLVKEMGYGVKIVSGGKDALWEVATDHVGIVLMDGLMDDVNGIETANAINNIRPDLPVIMITGHPEVIDEILKQQTPKLPWVKKPINSEQKAKLERLLQQYSQDKTRPEIQTAKPDRDDGILILMQGSIIAFISLLVAVITLSFGFGLGSIFIYLAIFVQSLHYYGYWLITRNVPIRSIYLQIVILGSIVLTLSNIIALLLK